MTFNITTVEWRTVKHYDVIIWLTNAYNLFIFYTPNCNNKYSLTTRPILIPLFILPLNNILVINLCSWWPPRASGFIAYILTESSILVHSSSRTLYVLIYNKKHSFFKHMLYECTMVNDIWKKIVKLWTVTWNGIILL